MGRRRLQEVGHNKPAVSVISIFIPTLWRVFVYFARSPFTELTFTDCEGLTPQHQYIDEDGFVRAYSLLAGGGSNC
jgi:hypothetical protein